MFDPLRRERDTFRLLLYVLAVAAVVVALVLIGRAVF